MDSAPSHPSADSLVSAGGNVKCSFLLPTCSVTSLVQPIDQGIFENLKSIYKRNLRNVLVDLSDKEEFINFTAKLTVKDTEVSLRYA